MSNLPTLQKVLISSCPKCGRASAVAVKSYKTGLKAVDGHHFYCNHCDDEFKSAKERIQCDVVPVQMMGKLLGRRSGDRVRATA